MTNLQPNKKESIAHNMHIMLNTHASTVLTSAWQHKEKSDAERLLNGSAQILRDLNSTLTNTHTLNV